MHLRINIYCVKEFRNKLFLKLIRYANLSNEQPITYSYTSETSTKSFLEIIQENK